MKMTLETFVNAAPDVVFRAGTDFANMADRMVGITKVEMLTTGDVGVGTKFKETRTVMGKDATEEMEVTAFDPPRSYTLEADSCGSRYVSTFVLTPKDGGTKVALNISSKAQSCFALAFAPLGFFMKGTMRKMIQKDLDDLKRNVEASGLAASHECIPEAEWLQGCLTRRAILAQGTLPALRPPRDAHRAAVVNQHVA